MELYKIYDPVRNLYSSGGSYGWAKRGKTWNSIPNVKAHLRCNDDRRLAEYQNAVLIGLGDDGRREIQDIPSLIQEVKQQQFERILNINEAVAKKKELDERLLLRKLLAKYPDEKLNK
jgi:serine phosphatase RsbU (regulator of sigma subunit)